MKIGIIGDYNPLYPSQTATADALNHSIRFQNRAPIEVDWIPTVSIAEQLERIQKTYKGFWIAPGIPEAVSGVLQIIQYARECNVPLLGTCAGFQYMMLEFARNKLKLEEADHEELNPDASQLVINKLVCSLVGQTGEVHIISPFLVSDIYRKPVTIEQFRCSYGLNPEFEAAFKEAGLQITGTDNGGRPRIIELPGHPFFIGTLFVPQLSSTEGHPHCLIDSFIKQVSGRY